jgi:hypothetical protein
MAQAIGQFSIANQPESDLFTFDFVNDLPADDAVTAATWACTVASGVDADAADRLVGSPTLFNTRVSQRGAGFLPGVQYVMACTATTRQGNTLVLWAYLDGGVVGC